MPRTTVTIACVLVLSCSGGGQGTLDGSISGELGPPSDGLPQYTESGLLLQDGLQQSDSETRTDPCSADPLWTATASGVASFVYQHRPQCNPPPGTLNTFVHNQTFLHSVLYDLRMDSRVIVSVPSVTRVPSGKVFDLVVTPGNSVIDVSVLMSAFPSMACGNLCQQPPPQQGTVSFTYSSTDKGSQIRIDVNGYLCCTQDARQRWERFQYVVVGQSM